MTADDSETVDRSFGAQMQARAEEAAELLKAISNPQRLRVMCILIDGEKTVGELNAQIELSQSALSQHLAVLRDGGLVRTRRESQNVFYSVADGPVHRVIQALHDAYCPYPEEGNGNGTC